MPFENQSYLLCRKSTNFFAVKPNITFSRQELSTLCGVLEKPVMPNAIY